MRIKELGLVAFGLFSDYRIDLAGNRGLTLIYGLNEAGKSTVLRAIQDFLYGIPLSLIHISPKILIRLAITAAFPIW